MAKIRHQCGYTFCFHGSFLSKAAAERKEATTPGAFIRGRRVRGRGFRWLVLTERRA